MAHRGLMTMRIVGKASPFVRRLAALALVAALAGCYYAPAPGPYAYDTGYYGGYYGGPAYYGPSYYGPPVSLSFGYWGGGGGYHHHRWH
jgi:hypothetical protein